MKKFLTEHPAVIVGIMLCILVYAKMRTTKVVAVKSQPSVIILITNGAGNPIAIQLPMDVWITTNPIVKQHKDGSAELEINQ